MSSLLNNASLLLNPAGSVISYKEDKINLVIPRNGAGDFGFEGGNGGTRVNQDGYIETVPRNLISDSADFTTWTKDASLTRTDNQPDPFGTNTAAKFSNNLGGGNPGNAFIYKSVNYIAGATYTFSLYIKGDSAGSITLRYDDSTTGPNYAVNYTTEWQRFSVTRTVNSTSGIFVLGGYSAWTPGENITVAFAQHELYSTPRPYQPTTDRLNYPRIDYQDGRGKLLLELTRTNQLLYSNKFDESVWDKTNVGVTASAAISPDGTSNAWKLVPNTSVSGQYILQNSSVTSGTRYVQTVFAKAGEYQWLQFAPSTGFASSYVNFNLANGTIGTNTTGYIATIKPLRDGWYRCALAHNATSTTTGGRIVIAPIQSDSQGRLPNWAGDGTSGIYIYGAQLESGGHPSIVVNIDYPTSYIPTTSATVTRPNDYSVKSNISSLLSQNDGTLYVSAVNYNTNQEFVAVSSVGLNTSDMVIAYQGGGTLNVSCLANSSLITNGTLALPVGSYFKAAIRYKNGDSAVYINGQQRTTNSTSFSFANNLNVIQAYSSAYYFATPGASGLGTTAVFTSGLTNTQLAELTTVRSGSGGNISYYGPYTIHTFTGSATFTPSFNGEVEVLVVAGGGAGGGGDVGGGGGAGGLIYASSYGVSQGTGITVTIGAGGTGVANAGLAGGNGSNSVFGGLTAIGGGGGAGWTKGTGNDGGSGGGSTWYGVGGKGIPGQGNDGGTGGVLGPPYPQCGGGGAGEAGFPAQSSTVAGNGGDGLPYSISGFSTYYAGGGGGATEGSPGSPSSTGTPGTGGLGGGGNGGSQGAGTLGTPGVAYTGGGGGGCDPQAGANGGSGVVIVRYLT
jgi:hypothetical protein